MEMMSRIHVNELSAFHVTTGQVVNPPSLCVMLKVLGLFGSGTETSMCSQGYSGHEAAQRHLCITSALPDS